MSEQTISRYRGVSWDPSRGRWKVQIASAARGWRYSCRFDEEGAAARGYDHLARVLLGDEAVLNFPGEPMCEADRAWVEGVIHKKAGAQRAERGRKRKADQARRSGEAKAKREAAEERKNRVAAARAEAAAIPKMGRHEACERFGVSLNTWQRWEREGQVTCGYQVDGRNMYPVAEIERLIERHGVMRPPYEDPAGGRGRGCGGWC